MIFKDPWILLLLPFVVFLLYTFNRKKSPSAIMFSSKELVKNVKPTARIIMAKNLAYLRMAAVVLFFLALARPQSISEETKVFSEGIDIVLALDSSGSMLAEDFTIGRIRHNRLEVAKKVVEDFVRRRKTDRIGIITFAKRAYTVCPLTLDYDWLIENLGRIEVGSIEDGTAIGSAIASSLNRLEDTKGKSKIIILLTDGINNAGRISPITAAKAAKAMKVKIYTIGAGSKGLVPYPVRTPWGEVVYENVRIDLDEDTLKEMAEITGGKYFRATDTKSLEEIYGEIDALEKTPVEETGFRRYEELFSRFLLFGLLFLAIEIIFSNTLLRKLP